MTSPLSRQMFVADLTRTWIDVEADADERIALARHLGLVSLERLRAELLITPEDGMIGVQGMLRADLTQSCVVTLVPVTCRIDVPLQRRFGPDDEDEAGDDNEELTLQSADSPDPVIDGLIDLGAVVTEQLALEINPFPRASEADFGALETIGAGIDGGGGAFAVLAALKDKLEKKS
jgi:uncharacterized metal-binding protein YceD (DUF177 family)